MRIRYENIKNLGPYLIAFCLLLAYGYAFGVGPMFYMENQIEVWKPVVGWEEMYLVSNFGNLRSLDRKVGGPRPEGRIIKGKLRKFLVVRGYLSVNLIDKKSGKSTRNSVHRFVAEAFIPNPENKLCVNHIDGNKQNNHISNLEWCTYKENSEHAIRTGLKRPHKFTEEQKQKISQSGKGKINLALWQKNNKPKMVEQALRASLLMVKKVNQFDKSGIFVKQWDSMADACRATNATPNGITNCTKGRLKTSGGFKWALA